MINDDNIIIEFWCNNPECEEYTNDPDNYDGVRTTLHISECYDKEKIICPCCYKTLICRSDLNTFKLLKELGI